MNYQNMAHGSHFKTTPENLWWTKIHQENLHPSPPKMILKINKMDLNPILQNIWLNTSHKQYEADSFPAQSC